MSSEINHTACIVSSAIYGVLVAVDMNAATAFRQLYPEPQDQSIDAQIIHANRFWRNQLAQIDSQDTMHAKLCLQDGIDYDNWIRAFSLHIAPLVSRFELPSNYSGQSIADKFNPEDIYSRLANCVTIQQVDPHG
jgi:hypothetical protein